MDIIVINGDEAEIELLPLGDAIVPKIVGYAVGPKGEPGIIYYTPEFEQARNEAVAAAEEAAASKSAAAESEHQAGLSQAAAETAREATETAHEQTVEAMADLDATLTAVNLARDETVTAKDTVLTKATEIAADAQTATEKAEAATTAAEAAATTLEEVGLARDETVAARGTIDADMTTVNQAKTDVLAAKTTAVSAAGTAGNNAATALEAKELAVAANEAAQTAKTDVDTAVETVNAASTAAGEARDQAVTAKEGIDAIQGAINTARDTVLTTANDVAEIRDQIETLVEDIDGVDFTAYVVKSNNGSDFTDPAQFRTNLNLQIALPTVTSEDAEEGASEELALWSPASVRASVEFFVTGYAAQKIHQHTTADILGLDMVLLQFATKEDAELSGVPTAPTADLGTNTNQVATMAALKAAVDAAVSGLINGSPGALDTLKELADALGDDPNFASTITTQLSYKATLADPEFTGIPKAPTAAPGTNTTQLATTAFVAAGLALKAEAVHTHVIADITDLQAALDTKLDKAGGSMTGDLNVRRVRITNTTDGTEATATHPFQIGGSGAYNLIADTKKIMARNNGALAPLGLSGSSIDATAPLTVAGTINSTGTITSASDITASSDRRLKKNLQVIDNALDKVLALTGYTYDRRDIEVRQTGLIAQDVQKVLPEAVGTSEKGLTVAYGQLAGLLVEAIKELHAELSAFRAEVEAK